VASFFGVRVLTMPFFPNKGSHRLQGYRWAVCFYGKPFKSDK
jgi:hypothetical protein